jgi:hypothetical protein
MKMINNQIKFHTFGKQRIKLMVAYINVNIFWKMMGSQIILNQMLTSIP